MEQRLLIVADTAGAATLGWMTRGVLYVALRGGIGSDLGARCSFQIEALLASASNVRCFCDLSSPNDVNLSARTAIVGVLFANRVRLSDVTILIQRGAALGMAKVIGNMLERVSTTENAQEFDRWLSTAAPISHWKVDPQNCILASPSEPPKPLVVSARI
jgi:hypothetical protein